MIKITQKSQKNRSVFKKFETSKKLIKSITENLNYSNTMRWNILKKLYDFSLASSKTRLIFKCILKGSKRGVNKFYHYSRHTFIKLVRFGIISGLYKANW